MAFPGRMHTNT